MSINTAVLSFADRHLQSTVSFPFPLLPFSTSPFPLPRSLVFCCVSPVQEFYRGLGALPGHISMNEALKDEKLGGNVPLPSRWVRVGQNPGKKTVSQTLIATSGKMHSN